MLGQDEADGATLGVGHSRHWLYPVQHGMGRQFTGRVPLQDPAFGTYRSAILANEITGGTGPLESGFLTIQPDDVLWLYADPGIAGRATVRKVLGRPEPSVTFVLDRPGSKVLAQDPIPRELTRKRLPGSIDRLIPLAEHPEVLEGFEWWLGHLGQRDRHRLEPLGIPSLREVMSRRRTLHDPTFGALIRTFRLHDLALGLPGPKDGTADLVARNGTTLIVAQVLDLGRGAVPRTLLDAIGPLTWCGWQLTGRAPELALEPLLWFACRQVPDPGVVRFLEDQGCMVSWHRGDDLELGPRTLTRWHGQSAGLPTLGTWAVA